MGIIIEIKCKETDYLNLLTSKHVYIGF